MDYYNRSSFVLCKELEKQKRIWQENECEREKLSQIAEMLAQDVELQKYNLDKEKRRLQRAKQTYRNLCNCRTKLHKSLMKKDQEKQYIEEEMKHMRYKVNLMNSKVETENLNIQKIALDISSEDRMSDDCCDDILPTLETTGEDLAIASCSLQSITKNMKQFFWRLKYLSLQMKADSSETLSCSSSEEEELLLACQKSVQACFDHPLKFTQSCVDESSKSVQTCVNEPSKSFEVCVNQSIKSVSVNFPRTDDLSVQTIEIPIKDKDVQTESCSKMNPELETKDTQTDEKRSCLMVSEVNLQCDLNDDKKEDETKKITFNTGVTSSQKLNCDKDVTPKTSCVSTQIDIPNDLNNLQDVKKFCSVSVTTGIDLLHDLTTPQKAQSDLTLSSDSSKSTVTSTPNQNQKNCANAINEAIFTSNESLSTLIQKSYHDMDRLLQHLLPVKECSELVKECSEPVKECSEPVKECSEGVESQKVGECTGDFEFRKVDECSSSTSNFFVPTHEQTGYQYQRIANQRNNKEQLCQPEDFPSNYHKQHFSSINNEVQQCLPNDQVKECGESNKIHQVKECSGACKNQQVKECGGTSKIHLAEPSKLNPNFKFFSASPRITNSPLNEVKQCPQDNDWRFSQPQTPVITRQMYQIPEFPSMNDYYQIQQCPPEKPYFCNNTQQYFPDKDVEFQTQYTPLTNLFPTQCQRNSPEKDSSTRKIQMSPQNDHCLCTVQKCLPDKDSPSYQVRQCSPENPCQPNQFFNENTIRMSPQNDHSLCSVQKCPPERDSPSCQVRQCSPENRCQPNQFFNESTIRMSPPQCDHSMCSPKKYLPDKDGPPYQVRHCSPDTRCQPNQFFNENTYNQPNVQYQNEPSNCPHVTPRRCPHVDNLSHIPILQCKENETANKNYYNNNRAPNGNNADSVCNGSLSEYRQVTRCNSNNLNQHSTSRKQQYWTGVSPVNKNSKNYSTCQSPRGSGPGQHFCSNNNVVQQPCSISQQRDDYHSNKLHPPKKKRCQGEAKIRGRLKIESDICDFFDDLDKVAGSERYGDQSSMTQELTAQDSIATAESSDSDVDNLKSPEIFVVPSKHKTKQSSASNAARSNHCKK